MYNLQVLKNRIMFKYMYMYAEFEVTVFHNKRDICLFLRRHAFTGPGGCSEIQTSDEDFRPIH